MAAQKRASHPDVISIEMQRVPSPAPTYTSTFTSQNFPSAPKGGPSNDPCIWGASGPTFEQGHSIGNVPLRDQQDIPVTADYHDPNHPHFAKPTAQHYSSSLPLRRRLPQKRILIPWILAFVFFLTTAWYTSILAGLRFLSVLSLSPATPSVQEINIIISDEILHGIVSTSTTITTVPPGSALAPTQTLGSTATPVTDSESVLPTTTGRLHLAPKPGTPPEDNTSSDPGISLGVQQRSIKTAPTGFVTITKRVT